MLESIGLGGDGDEVDAIERVEARFGILFDRAECERFVTVGDIWRALLRRGCGARADGWRALVAALGEETLGEDDLAKATPATRLLT